MIIQNGPVKVSVARLSIIDESRYQSLFKNSPAVLLDEVTIIGEWIAATTTSETTDWKQKQSTSTSVFAIEMDHPFTMSSLVVEGSVSLVEKAQIQLWNLTAQVKTISVDNLTLGVVWMHPLCGLAKCVAFKRLAARVQTNGMTTKQRVEYQTHLVDLASNEAYLRNVSKLVYRLPEEYIGVAFGSIYVRRSMDVPMDSDTFTISPVGNIPQFIKESGLDYCISRTKQDVVLEYPLSNLTDVNSYLDSAGAAAWFNPSFNWLVIANSITFKRVVSSYVTSFLEQEYDRYAFVLGEFAEWITGNVSYNQSLLLTTFSSLTKVLNKLSNDTFSATPSLQHRSLLSLVKEQCPALTREQQLMVCCAVDMRRGRLTTTFEIDFQYTSTEAVEISVLSTLGKLPYFMWPIAFLERLTVESGQLIYRIGGDALRPINLVSTGHSEYSSWYVDLLSQPDVIAATDELWNSLITMFEIVVSLIAADEVIYITEGIEKKAIIQAKYSKLYGRMMHYMCSVTDAIIVPIRRYSV